MVDILESKVVGTNKETWYKLIGTSEDTKPTGEFPAGTGHMVANSSKFYEVDTETGYELKERGWITVGQNIRLPDVTAEDNGKVLTVVDGAWNKAEPASNDGNSIYFYTAPVPNTNKIKLLNDKTVADITACLNNQKVPILVHGSNSSNISFTPYVWTDQDDNGHEIYVFSSSSISYENGEFKPFIAATYFETTDPTATRGTVMDYDISTT